MSHLRLSSVGYNPQPLVHICRIVISVYSLYFNSDKCLQNPKGILVKLHLNLLH